MTDAKKILIDPEDFRVLPGKKVKLKDWPTCVKPVYSTKEQYKEILDNHVAKMVSYQELLYACNRYALLLILQGMDSAGKDGAIRHVMSGINPKVARFSALNSQARKN